MKNQAGILGRVLRGPAVCAAALVLFLLLPASAQSSESSGFTSGWSIAREDILNPSAPTPRPRPLELAVRLGILEQALFHYENGRHEAVLERTGQVLKHDAGDPIALILKGAAEFALERWDRSIAAFETYTSFHPLDAEGYFNLGVVHHLVGNYASASESYWTALLLEPTLEEARENRDQIEAMWGDS